MLTAQELKSSPLFHDISYEEYRRMLTCFQAAQRSYVPEEQVYDFASSRTDAVGIVERGQVSLIRIDEAGVATVLEDMGPGGVFGRHLAFAGFAADRIGIIFLYAIPVAFIPLIVFTSLWWPLPHRFVCASGLDWSLVLCLRLTFQTERLNSIFIIAAIVQVLIILWFVLRYRTIKRKKAKGGSAE